jgi:hypothetical protein
MSPPILGPEVDITTRMSYALVDHWPLVAALLITGYWIFPRVLKSTLLNGAGDIIRGIVREENVKQSVHAKEALDTRLKEHELQESARFQRGEDRFRQIEDEIAEMSGPLPRRRRRR